MSITVATSKLIDTLTDALSTASDAVGGIHMATHRAPWRDEPSDVDLLAATSTTRSVIGHTWIPVDGRLRPAVWPTESAKTVKAICESLVKKGKDIHTVDIDMVMADPPEDPKEGEHPGWTVTLSETPALFESETEFQFHAHHESKFPAAMVRRVLSGKSKANEEVVETPLTEWSPGVLAPLVAVSKRRKAPMRFFRSDESWVQVVQIGDTWLGAAFPIRPLPGESTSEPSIDPVLGDATDDLLDTLAEMKANGVTVTVDNPKGEFGKTISAAADMLRNGSGVVMGRVDPPSETGEPVELNEQFRANAAEVVGESTVAADNPRLYREAIELVVASQFASGSMLQRKLNIGHAKAAGFLEAMEGAGIVGPAEGSKARTVAFKPDQVTAALLAAQVGAE